MRTNSRRQHLAWLAAAVLSVSWVAPVGAKDPYKAKNVVTVLARDIGVDPAQIRSAKAASCALVDPLKPKYDHGNLAADYRDCLAVEFPDTVRFFAYYQKKYDPSITADHWEEVFLSKPQVIRGAKMAEVKSLGAWLRQIQLELDNGLIIAIRYEGGLLGDNKYPLEAIKRLNAMGFPTFAGVDYVGPMLYERTKTITIY